MSETGELYTFYFKITYTDRIFYFSFNPDITIKKFIESVEDEFNYYEPNRHIEIVEGDQFNNINGRAPELAPKINYNDEYTLRDVYGTRWNNITFYIRFIPVPES